MTGLTSGRGAAYNVTRKIKLVMGLESGICKGAAFRSMKSCLYGGFFKDRQLAKTNWRVKR